MEFELCNTEVLCLVCPRKHIQTENFKAEEQWIKCMDCGNSSHFERTGISENEKHYISDNCMSD